MVGLHFQAIRRKGNKFADTLTNEGMAGTLCLKSRAWQELGEGELHQQCTLINDEDNYST